MLIGYARVSKNEQNLDLQLDALKAAGCEKIFHDKITSLKEERKGLDEALAFLRPGDALVVWKLDRLILFLKSARCLTSHGQRFTATCSQSNSNRKQKKG